jgi:hypothetical protein
MIGPFDFDDDATPLTREGCEGLIPAHITLGRELNELEQKNIAEADGWVLSRKRNLLDEAFLRGFHRRMFNRVSTWAGVYRRTEHNRKYRRRGQCNLGEAAITLPNRRTKLLHCFFTACQSSSVTRMKVPRWPRKVRNGNRFNGASHAAETFYLGPASLANDCDIGQWPTSSYDF